MIELQPQPSSAGHSAPRKPRVALVCDFREEDWPSMDLVGNMVFEHLERQFSDELHVTRICPPMRRRFGLLPLVGKLPMFENADRLMNRFGDYSRFLKRQLENFELFHLVDHSYAQLVHVLPAGRTIVTCHDLDTFRCILEPQRDPRPRWFRAMVERILTGFQKAAHVVADSAATRDDILRYGLVPEDRVTLVHNGVHPALSAEPDPGADSELTRLIPFENTVWLLSVGSSIPRKRLDLLLRIFAEVRKEAANVRLMRIGDPLTFQQRQVARELGVEPWITELGRVSLGVLASAYRRSRVLLQTSDAEGFGLPLIEAMACGCAVIASDLPVLREVGGAAAVYCALGDIQGWKDAVLRTLAGPRQDGMRMREKGFPNAARFSWAENAAETVRIYEKVMGKEI